MLGLLIGRIGMSKAEAVTLTSEEIEAIFKAYNEGEMDAWRRTRWLATQVANFSGNAKKGGIKPTDFFKFDDEKKKSSGIEELFKIAVKNG